MHPTGKPDYLFMKNYLNLSIPYPCHEKWENFQPTGNGGFCASCNKEVIDFTSWTESEIKAYFKEGNGSTCGRFRAGQLKTYQLGNDTGQKSTLLPLSFLGMTLLLTPGQSDAAELNRLVQKVTEFKIQESKPIMVAQDSGKITITGVVMDGVDNIPVPGASVVLKNTIMGTSTDEHGRFSITIENPEKNNVLVFSFIGYEMVEQSVNAGTGEMKVILHPDDVSLGEVIVVGGICERRSWTPGGIWWKIKNIFR